MRALAKPLEHIIDQGKKLVAHLPRATGTEQVESHRSSRISEANKAHLACCLSTPQRINIGGLEHRQGGPILDELSDVVDAHVDSAPQQILPAILLQGSVEHLLDLLVFHRPAEFSQLSQPSLEVLELMLVEERLRSEFCATLVGQLELVDIGQPRRQGILFRIAYLGECPS